MTAEQRAFLLDRSGLAQICEDYEGMRDEVKRLLESIIGQGPPTSDEVDFVCNGFKLGLEQHRRAISNLAEFGDKQRALGNKEGETLTTAYETYLRDDVIGPRAEEHIAELDKLDENGLEGDERIKVRKAIADQYRILAVYGPVKHRDENYKNAIGKYKALCEGVPNTELGWGCKLNYAICLAEDDSSLIQAIHIADSTLTVAKGAMSKENYDISLNVRLLKDALLRWQNKGPRR